MPKIVPGTYHIYDFGQYVFDFEAFDKDGKEDPKVLKAVTTETTTEIKAKTKYNSLISEGYSFTYNVFDVIFWYGEDVTDRTFLERLELTNHFGERNIDVFTEK